MHQNPTEPTPVPDIRCAGCGARPISCALAIASGQVACCPDCSTFTLSERNSLRAAILDAFARFQQQLLPQEKVG